MHDLNTEFDLKLRSLLDGVEEEVPQRVWEGVSSRVGKKRAPVAWMRWAGASLAAAAAVALAVVLSGTFKGGSDSIMPVQENLVAEVQAPVTPAEEVSEPEMEVPQNISSATTRKPVSRIRPEAAKAVAVSPEETVNEPAASDAQETSAAPQKASEKKSTKTQAWDDPFARMAYEDAHARQPHRMSIGLNGLVGTNDGAKPGSHGSGMMGASGDSRFTGVSEEGESHYGVPVSFGVGARYHLTDKWSVGTGVNFSQLSRKFDGLYYTEDGLAFNGEFKHSVQYIGIPVNIFYDVISNKVFDFYTFAGGSVEKCISNKYIIPVKNKSTIKGDTSGFQYSAALGLGVQFNLTDKLGLYIDPSARYWMGKDQPKSIRTQQPFMFNIEIGLKFEL